MNFIHENISSYIPNFLVRNAHIAKKLGPKFFQAFFQYFEAYKESYKTPLSYHIYIYLKIC